VTLSFNLTHDEIERRVYRAISKLRERDEYLLDARSSERSITHHFAVYLHREFERWHVDIEYNRDGHEIKRLRNLLDAETDRVSPDIIVHTRGTNEDNLLVVEVKKRGSENGADKNKLIEFTKPLTKDGLGYRWGLHLSLDCGALEEDSLTWYECGESHG
jgi:hypothetical protein